MGWLKRLRTTRGFGVHSPFAYHFITEVLTLPHAYYAETRMDSRLLRVAFRTILELQPRRLAVYAPAVFSQIAKEAIPDIQITPTRPDMVVFDAAAATQADRDQLRADIAAGASAIVYNTPADLAARILAALPQGMTFANTRDTLIAVNRPLPRQDYILNY